VLELLNAHLQAQELNRRLFERGQELLDAMPDAPDVPKEVRGAIAALAHAAMYKELTMPPREPETAQG
jgi:hypothetical protein